MHKLQQIKPEEWNGVCEFNKRILQDFLDNSTEFSPKTKQIYESNLRIWFMWVKDNLGNKRQIEIKPLEFKRFQNWLVNRGCSSADTNNKRAAISSLNGYIEIYYCDEYPTFRNFINKSIKRPAKKIVREKEPLTKGELVNLFEELNNRGEFQKAAYVMFTFETGCRRAATMQILKDIVNAKPIIKTREVTNLDGSIAEEEFHIYQTHPVREKGAGEQGKIRRLTFGDASMVALKKWLDVRGEDDCPYMFISTYHGKIKQVAEATINNWFTGVISEIVGRPIHPHTLRASRATQAVVEEGKDVEAVKNLLGHESQTTTLEYYVVKHDEENVDDLFS